MNLFSTPQQAELIKNFPSYTFEFYHQVTSTNDVCRSCWQQDPSREYVIVADEQTSGRGRRGRNWVSAPKSNLYFSFLFSNPGWSLAGINFYFGIVLYETLQQLFASQLSHLLTVKWPNDLYWEKKKIAGILLENLDNQMRRVIVGVGLNVLSHQEQLPPSATSLAMIIEKLPLEARAEILSTFLAKLQTTSGKISERKIKEKFWQYSQLTQQQFYSYSQGENFVKGKLLSLNQDGSAEIWEETGKRVCLY